MVTKVFQLLLLISPIAVGADINLEMFDIIFFRTGIIALFMASLIDKPQREMPQDIKWIILSLLGLCIINVFINTFSPTVLMNFQNLFLGVVGFYIVYTYFDKTQDIRPYILWAGVINLLLFIGQRIGFDPVFDKRVSYAGEEGAFLGNKQRLMTYFALITPFVYRPLLLLMLALGIFTRQYIIFIPVMLVLYATSRKVAEKLGVLILFLLTVVWLKNNLWQSLSFRFNIAWKPALQLFFDRPLIGYGLGNRIILDLEVLGNSYLQFIVGVGIAGLVWFGYVFKKFWKAIIFDVAILSLALLMFIEYVLEIPRLWYLVIGIITMFLIKQKEIVQNESS